MQIFARDGYGNASIAQVAAKVGLTLPGLLHYFPSKTQMLLAVLDMRDLRSSPLPGQPAADLETVAAGPPLPWADYLDQLRRINRSNAQMPGVIRAFSLLNTESLAQDHPAQAWFARRAERVLTVGARSLRQAQQRGEVDPTADPEQVAAEIVSVMDGLQILWLRRPDRLDLVKFFEDYLDRLQHALAIGSQDQDGHAHVPAMPPV